MMRHRYSFLIGFGAAVVILGMAVLSFTTTSHTTAAGTGTPNLPRAVWPTSLPAYARTPVAPNFTTIIVPPTISPDTGWLAIPPTIQTSDPKAAAFTEQDVRAFYAQRFPTSVVTQVAFLTVSQAWSTMHVEIPYDANELACVVVQQESGITPLEGKPYTTLTKIYSAHYGTLLGVRYL